MSLFSLPRGGTFMRRLEVAVIALLACLALFGASLVAPAAAQQGTTTSTTNTTYIVQPGDNLYRIGLKFGLNVNALAQANGIVNPNFVFVGEKLIIPAGAIIPAPAAGVTLVPTLALTEAAIYLALAPKSDSAKSAYSAAAKDAHETVQEPVPLHIRNAPTKLMKGLGYGEGYKYAHDYEGHVVKQEYLPEKKRYYFPTEQGQEKQFKAYLDSIRTIIS